MTITLTREEAQQVLDALQCATPPTFSAKIVEDWQNAVEFLRARLSAPEPEPVACKQCGAKGIHACIGYRWEEGRTPPSVTFTAPPQREWQGLTDKEIMDACSAVWASHPVEVGNVVQDLLKDKNT